MPVYKRVLPGLSPDQRYIVRVRGVSKFGVYSDWSEAIDFNTPSDQSVPNPPTDLSVDFNSPDLLLDWIPPEFNTDGSFFRDFDHYDVTLSANSIEKTYKTFSPFFSFTFAQNETLFGTPQPDIHLEIRAVDVSGNRSEPLVGDASNPEPLTPGDITGNATIQTIVLSFTPDPSDRDIKEYIIERSMTGQVASWVEIARSQNDGYLDQVESEPTTYYYRYRVADYFDQTSPYSAVFSIDSVPVPGIDEDPPPAVQDFTIVGDGVEPSTHRAFIDVEWTPINLPPEEDDLASYEVRVTRVSDGRLLTYMQGPNASSFRIENLLLETDYELVMYAYDYSGNRSPASAVLTHTTPADDSAPETPLNYGTIPANRSITVYWDPVEHTQISHYEVYGSTTQGFTPDTATFANRLFLGNATRFVQNTGDAETWYFRIRAVNTNGMASGFTAEFSETSNDSFTRDTVPPAVPTDIAATSGMDLIGQVSMVYADISWTAVGDADLAGYNVRLRRVGETRYEYADVPVGNESAKFTGIVADVQYGVQVAAYDVYGNYSAYSTEHTFYTVKDNDAPPVPLNPGSSTTLRSISWYWDAVVADDLSHYEAQVDNTDNTFASVVSTFTGLATGFNFIATQIQMYYMRVRAVDVSGNASAWSTVATGTSSEIEGVDIDTQAPAIPSGLTLDTGTEFTGARESIYLNASWTENVEGDLAGYSVRLRRGSETRYEFRDVLAGNGSVKFVGLEPKTQYGVQIAAYDGFGNYSAYSTPEQTIVTAGDTQAPGVPQNLSGSVSLRSVQWSWDDVNVSDLAYYYAEVATANDFVNIVETYKGTSDSFTFVAPDIDTYYMRVKAVDLSGNDSGFSAAVSATTTTVEGVDLDSVAPATPTSVTATSGVEFTGQQENIYIVASWTSNSEPDLSGYSVRIRKPAGSYEYATVDGSNNSVKFTGMQANTTYEVSVSAFDAMNNYSPYSAPYSLTSAVDSGAPNAPTNLRLSSGVRSIIAQWDGVSANDLKHYNVYISDSNNQNRTLYSSVSATMESINRYHDGTTWQDLTPLDTFYIEVSAEDHSGNESPAVNGSVQSGQVGSVDIEEQSIGTAHIAELIADRITSGTLSAVVTVSGTIRTAETNARMEMTDQGLIGYAPDGTTENFRYDNADGSVTLKGAIQSGSTISGTTITGGAFQTNTSVPTLGGIRIDGTDGFQAFEPSQRNAHISIDGVATFKKATIAGDASDIQLTVGTSNTILKIDTSGLYMGNSSFATAPFSVTYTGDLRASSIDIAGGIVSGPLTLNGASSRLRVGSDTNSGGRLTITKEWTRVFPNGSTGDLDEPTFEIDHITGDITLNQGTLNAVTISASSTITGAAIVGSELKTNETPHANPGSGILINNTDGFVAYRDGIKNVEITPSGAALFRDVEINGAEGDVFIEVGSSSFVWKVDSDGMYMGNITFATAPFSVDYAGNVKAAYIDLGNGAGTGGTINGTFNLIGQYAKLRLGSSNDSGARISITQNWFRAFGTGSLHDGNDVTFEIQRSSGNVYIRDGELEAPSVVAGVLTGSTYQTQESVPTNGGIVIDGSNGLRAFDGTSLNARIGLDGSAIFNDVLITGAGKSADELIINTGKFTVQADGDVEASNIKATGGTIAGTDITTVNGVPTLSGGTISGANFILTNPGQIEFQGSGKIIWNALASGGIELSGNGYINNSDYRTWEDSGFTGDPQGWLIDETGIHLYDENSTIAAAALNIGVSSTNLIKNGSFGAELDAFGDPLPLAKEWASPNTAAVTFSVEENGTRLYQKTSQRAQVTSNSNVHLTQTISPPGGFEADKTISVSFWVRQTAGTARVGEIYVTTPGGTVLRDGTNVTLALNSWVRIVETFVITTTHPSIVVELRVRNAIAGDVFYFDGAQVERSDYPTDFKPGPLDIPVNYIDSVHISGLTADRIDSGVITSAEISIAGTGKIYSFDYVDGVIDSGWQFTSDQATFYNGSIEIIAAGGADTDSGYVVIDGQSVRLQYGTSGALDTKFKVDQSGVYIGGESESTADIYFNGDKTVFRSNASGYVFTIDTTPEDTPDPDPDNASNQKILSLENSGDYTFYLDTAGKAYFKGGIVDGITVNNSNTIFGTLVIRNVLDTKTLGTLGSSVLAEDMVLYHGLRLNDSDNVWGSDAEATLAIFRVGNKSGGGNYIEYKDTTGALDIKTDNFSVIGGNATFSGSVVGGTLSTSAVSGRSIFISNNQISFKSTGLSDGYIKTLDGTNNDPIQISMKVPGSTTNFYLQNGRSGISASNHTFYVDKVNINRMDASEVNTPFIRHSPGTMTIHAQDGGINMRTTAAELDILADGANLSLRSGRNVNIVVGNWDQLLFNYNTRQFYVSNIDSGTWNLGASSRMWNITYTNRTYVSSGTALSPSYTFQPDPNTGMYNMFNGNIGFSANGSLSMQIRSDRVRPGQDNDSYLGDSSFRWIGVYAIDSTINSSDETTKTDIEESPLGLEFIKTIRPIKYVRDERVRPHYGFSAQQIKQTIDEFGVDFAGYIDPSYEAQPDDQCPYHDDDMKNECDAWHEEQANLRTATKGLRYSEFIAPLTKAMQELAKMVESLQTEVRELKQQEE